VTRPRAWVRRCAAWAETAVAPGAAWAGAETITINHFRPEGSDHRPRTTLRLLHSGRTIHGLFEVEDCYVRSRYLNYGDPVYRDSCVEIFLQPKGAGGYFNFEFNAGGVFLCFFITDPARVAGAFKEYVRPGARDMAGVRVRGSLPRTVEPEAASPMTWWLAFAIPVPALEKFAGPLGDLSGQTWRGNAYKCGNETSHPHWGAWAPVDALNFHLPHCFGELAFE